jgi:phosphoenolpyruvate carboxykinase (ATP)
MHNMLIRPTREQLAEFEPDYIIYNAGRFPANSHTPGLTSKTSVDLYFENREFVILGTQYAGEMKKGVFTIMNYIMPKQNVLSMHCSATEGDTGDVSLFFGLSGTGKTTLSADARRRLIGDDEHCWTDDGIFNIEGGCYAKVIGLSAEAEPQIYSAIRFGSVLENVVFDELSREIDYDDISITTNTRAAYPVDYIENAKIPGIGGHPSHVIFLASDAFGVLPPVSKLTPEQAMYHFLNGYTARIPGTEVDVTEPKATFSACFGAPFLVWPPEVYARMLADRMQQHGSRAWLINTGWSGGSYGRGGRIRLRYTRAMIEAIHSDELEKTSYHEEPYFGLQVPEQCPNVPDEILWPRNTWDDPAAYDHTAQKLVQLFRDNFRQYEARASEEVLAAGPR